MTKGDTYLVVGLGLMGGSYAMGLTKRGYRVLGIDADETAVAWAKEHGLVAEGAPAADTAAVEALVRRADCIVLALYPTGIAGWLRQYAAALKPGALLTDLAGVKGSFVAEAQRIVNSRADGAEFIPSHPMAGREVSGVQNATDALFFGANFLIVPTEGNTPRGIAFARSLAETLGFGRITELTVPQHDRMIGYVSQLTHAIAVSLMNANDDPQLPATTGDSFRDLTRIADINDVLWSELFLENAPALLEEIDAFTASLQTLRTTLAQNDREGLQRLMRQSAQRRREFGKQ